jgi:drug/metabolite transporter (DMT)-like permease
MYVLGILMSALTACCWAASPILLKRGMDGLSFLEVNAIRSIGSFGVLLTITLATDPAFLVWSAPSVFFLVILANTVFGNIVGDILYFAAIRHLGVSRAVPITSSYPLIVTAVSAFFFGESVTWNIILGTVLVILGVVLLRFEVAGGDRPAMAARGFLCALGAALAWGFTVPLTKYLLLQGIPGITIAFWRSVFLVGCTWIHWGIGTARADRGRIALVSPRAALAIVGAGAFGLGVGVFTFTKAVTLIPLSIVTPITGTSPLLTALFGIFVMREQSTAAQWTGIALIVAGSVAVGL